MRRRRARMEEETTGVDLTPMLDVVFIMLIFFIVTTSFVRESGVDIERPESSEATQRPDTQVLVAITSEGAIWVDGQAVDSNAVGERVRDALSGSNGNVIIQADRASQTGLLIQTMDRIRQAGVENVAVAASQGEG